MPKKQSSRQKVAQTEIAREKQEIRKEKFRYRREREKVLYGVIIASI